MAKTIARSDALQKWAGLSEVAPNGCWIWTGYTLNGYGYLRLGSRSERAMRWGYEQLVGPILDGLHLDHLCHDAGTCRDPRACLHRRCVNPKHLEPVTQAENNRRMHAQRAAVGAPNTPYGGAAAIKRKWLEAATCPRGHAWTPENTQTRRDGRRECRTCIRARKRRYRQRL